jgi:hypothetical protein
MPQLCVRVTVNVCPQQLNLIEACIDLPKTLDENYSRTLLGIDEEKREYSQAVRKT